MISYKVEAFGEIIDEIEPMLDAHWDEVGSFKEAFKRHIHYSEYFLLAGAGKLIVVTMRDDTKLVGYFIGALGKDLHRDTLTLPQRRVGLISALVYYVRPEYRGHARTLIREVERSAAACGCQIVHIRVKPGLNRAREFLEALGYKETEVTMTRLIGEAADAGHRNTRSDLSDQSVF